MIFLILIGANIFGYYMTMSRIPQEVVEHVTAMNLNRWIIVIGITVACFVISGLFEILLRFPGLFFQLVLII